jgi:hypothetical protein
MLLAAGTTTDKYGVFFIVPAFLLLTLSVTRALKSHYCDPPTLIYGGIRGQRQKSPNVPLKLGGVPLFSNHLTFHENSNSLSTED